jgi:hypothetical protein
LNYYEKKERKKEHTGEESPFANVGGSEEEDTGPILKKIAIFVAHLHFHFDSPTFSNPVVIVHVDAECLFWSRTLFGDLRGIFVNFRQVWAYWAGFIVRPKNSRITKQ